MIPESTEQTDWRFAEWYDRSINWDARLQREIPVLVDVFGPPGEGGIIDAGCGTGHQVAALCQRTYRVVGVDQSEEMLSIAREHADELGVKPRLVTGNYADLHARIGGGHDGLYCLGNALAAAGSRDAVRQAISQFSVCLRVGGRLFIQILNFEPMRRDVPCVRGPRITVVDGQEFISVRQFCFVQDVARVTNITLYKEGETWCQRAHCGTLYPAGLAELRDWLKQSSLRIDDLWGNYNRDSFDVDRSVDLIVVATRT